MNSRYQSLQQLEADIERCLDAINASATHIEHTLHVAKLMTLLNELPEWPAGQFSKKWLQHELLEKLVQQFQTRISQSTHLWLLVARAVHSPSDRALMKIELKWMVSSKKRYLLCANTQYNSPELIRIVYSSENQELIALYQRYLVAPTLRLFQGYPLPEAFIQLYRASVAVIEGLTMNSTFERIEWAAKVMQRTRRAKLRKDSEILRLSKLYDIPAEQAASMLRDANTPYRPRRCSSELSERIVKAASSVKCFTTVSHYTSKKYLASICDDGLCGRRTLRNNFYAFEAAALHKDDLKNGDDDTICLAANYVDPDASKHGVQIMFDAEKLAARNPAVFVKQKDLCMPLDVIRSVKLKNRDIHFSYTHFDDEYQDLTSTLFLLLDGNSCSNHYAVTVPRPTMLAQSVCENYLLMTSNRKQMHAILTLNFFRFIDGLCLEDNGPANAMIEELYAEIACLTDEELRCFMQDLAVKMTDSLEFNMVGCHLIDFDSMISIGVLAVDGLKREANLAPLVKIVMADLIAELNLGKADILMQVKALLPELVKSHRFLGYLIEKTKHPFALELLHDMKAKTPVVMWTKQLSLLYKNPSQSKQHEASQGLTPQ